MEFRLKSLYQPMGDQPEAIKKLITGVDNGSKHQVLLGVTGSGKTFTVANVVEKTQKPTLIISHNKTLATQLYQEFRDFFPESGVGFFISYYDYYLPESYIPQTDTYIAKETDINEEIDKLRLQATSLLFSRRDAIIIASVSCIYNIGSPLEYGKFVLDLKVGQRIRQRELEKRLVDLHYHANRWEINRSEFRRRGDLIEVHPADGDEVLQIELKEDQIVALSLREPFDNKITSLSQYFLYPAKHYSVNPETIKPAFEQIKIDLLERMKELKKEGKLVEAQRLEQRVEYDLEMIKEVGYVNGIENYSRYFDGRNSGDPPFTLLDYFHYRYDDDFLVVIDESHISVPQLRGMYRGDQSRKQTLIDFGFRLPSALDNRPLKFAEFLPKVPQIIYVSATPGEWEIEKSNYQVVEQLVRPTGLVEPEVSVRPTKNQVKDLIEEVLKRKKNGQRVLITTLTKRLAEDLSEYLAEPKNTRGEKVKVNYLHADVQTLDRSKILADLRRGDYDCIVGINLLREGLDLPEVSLVAILDADAYGFLRSKTSLIQIMGRAARNLAGEVILYADNETLAIKEAVAEVKRRREIQLEYNQKHNITPATIEKPIRGAVIENYKNKGEKLKVKSEKFLREIDPSSLTPKEIKERIKILRRKMYQLASVLEFEEAAKVRDQIKRLEEWGD